MSMEWQLRARRRQQPTCALLLSPQSTGQFAVIVCVCMCLLWVVVVLQRELVGLPTVDSCTYREQCGVVVVG